MDRLSEVRARCEAGRPVHITDVRYLLSEVEQLTARAEKVEAKIKSIHESLNFADKSRSKCANYVELAVSNGLALGRIAVAIQHDYDAEPPKGESNVRYNQTTRLLSNLLV